MTQSDVKLELCDLCTTCGFLNDSQPGVLREDMGLLHIINQQIVFPCHEQLAAYNSSHGKGKSENTGTLEMAEDLGVVKVCTGYIQSLKKSKVFPKNMHVSKLMDDVKEIDPRIMTIEDTIKYHKPKVAFTRHRPDVLENPDRYYN